MRFVLRPERDVDPRVDSKDDGFLATSTEPWLSLLPFEPALAGRLIAVKYRASFWDEPVRPVFRFWRGDESYVDRIAAGPVAGAGIWTGRLPQGTVRVSISPTNRPGAFDFQIESLRVRSWFALLCQGFRRHPKAARSAILTRLIGWGPESDVNLAWAIGATPLRDYATWHAARTRPIECGGLDRPRFDWSTAEPVHVVVTGDESAGLGRTLDSLKAQVFPFWTATSLDTGVSDDMRITRECLTMATRRLETLSDGTLTCHVRAGEILPLGALAYVAEQARRYPACRLFYGDALLASARMGPEPLFQPGRSPRLFQATGYPSPCFVREVASWSEPDRQAFVAAGRLPASWIATLASSEGRPLRRVLLETRTPPAAPVPSLAFTASGASALIVIPTRDHPALLRRVVTSIRARTTPGRYRIAVVDNGSVTRDATDLLAELARDTDVRRLDHPGPFNFSEMCNQAAASAEGDVLVFLNDDTEVLTDGWLDRLIAHAMTPDIGAVGAKLTYPDGRLQHIGVLLGMGGSAGHFGALETADTPGWAARNHVLHEVSAVTGACLAVARDKFEAVGGFDAVHLPVELSDIDLCLKLNARGWQTMVDPCVHLLHEESASRGGATFRRLDVYDRQRAIFVERWRHVLRDDPVFHPGLSLYSWQAALG